MKRSINSTLSGEDFFEFFSLQSSSYSVIVGDKAFGNNMIYSDSIATVANRGRLCVIWEWPIRRRQSVLSQCLFLNLPIVNGVVESFILLSLLFGGGMLFHFNV